MNEIEIFQVDAFARKMFGGNPAAVVPLSQWPSDSWMQEIAAENNLAETAFIVQVDEGYELRWFTPTAEVDLCGHATLAAAHVVFKHLETNSDVVNFKTVKAGVLSVRKTQSSALAMSFPAIALTPFNELALVEAALGAKPSQLFKGNYSEDQYDVVAVFEHEEDVAQLQPVMENFKPITSRGIIATAPGQSCDFVSRYFGPNFGIPEDPVTGSAHCLTAPFWASTLGKTELDAIQLSKRVGHLQCNVTTNQVELLGDTVEYFKGTLNIDNDSLKTFT